MPSSGTTIALLVQILLICDFVLAQTHSDTTAPAKPKHQGPLKYQPNVPGNVIVGILYTVLGLIFSYRVHQHHDRWALCLPIGAIASGIGFFIRISMNPDTVKIITYIVMQCLVVISPSTFLAFNYMLYGRLIAAVDPKFGTDKAQSKMEKSRFSFIPPRIVGRTFVWSDVFTFFIQCAAGGLESAGGGGTNPQLTNVGDKLFLAGVATQGVSYCLFTTLLTVAMLRLIVYRRSHPINHSGWSFMGLDSQTMIIICGLYFSSVFIIVRSIYRIVEFTQGYSGYLIAHEIFLFVLDAGPLVLAIGIWAIIWPSTFLDKLAVETRKSEQGYAMEEASSSQINSGSVNSSTVNQKDWAPLA
ncbi:hypothetical protein BGZ99_002974 [Dissophora globulifera]|uniref:RTA1-domain-containing protein n=1 Tax=Dissophora globulifera TaxID=979702 RepID=A0A9P6RPB6_9FUNG|nr:hypothetical protein BGZ99_002974 [Dissophora globulifera]